MTGAADVTATESDRRRRFACGTALLLRVLGLCIAFAFGSIAMQVRGLLGAHGIVPACDFLHSANEALGAHAWWAVPTVFWAGCPDGALTAVCWIGTAAGGLIASGVAQAPLLLLSWVLFLSVCSVGQPFLGFQWDALLLESSFLAAWLAPWRPLTRWRDIRAPRAIPFWLLRLLLFKLMFSSGCVKLTSGDEAWRALTALDYHFETQPLPTWIGYFAHQAPSWIHRSWTFGMFVVELACPLGVFLPRLPRLVAFAGLALLQVLIGLTGNYCFFNLLAFGLCLLLVDDACFPRAWQVPHIVVPSTLTVGAVAASLFAAFWGVESAAEVALTAGLRQEIPESLMNLQRDVAQWETINGYGLFARMTTERNEIAIEGSDDGVTWREYPFQWKPGDPHRRPGFVEPMQPRLDWQMWFAALGDFDAWLPSLLHRLLQGSPAVLKLFASNPFPDHPPRRVRLRTQEYRFTTIAELRATGLWWNVSPQVTYSRELTEESFSSH